MKLCGQGHALRCAGGSVLVGRGNFVGVEHDRDHAVAANEEDDFGHPVACSEN